MVKIRKKKKTKELRTKKGRLLFPEKMRFWGLFQADDYSQWIVAEVKAQTRHEAVWLFNKHYGYPENLVDNSLTGLEQDKYLRIVELGGMNLPFVMSLEPHVVREVVGLFELED